MTRNRRIIPPAAVLNLCGFLLLISCGPHYKKFVPPPPEPVNYSGAAPDDTWMNQQTQTYKDQGAAAPSAELTARVEYEREASGQKGAMAPFVSEIITPEKKKKKSKDKTDKDDKLASAPQTTPIPTPSPTPPVQVTPITKLIMNYGPSAPQQTAPITPFPMVPAPQPGVPTHPGE